MSSTLVAGVLAAHPALGCVFPADLEPAGSDGGPSSPPLILSASPPEIYSFPGPIVVDRQDSQLMVLEAVDNDLSDVLYVRLYVDYGRPDPEPAYADCQAPPNDTGQRQRSIPCQTNALCNPIVEGDDGNHVLEAMIADRPFLPNSDPAAASQPPFRALQDVEVAGYSFRSWVMKCGSQ